MRDLLYTYWIDDETYIGYLNDYPDYETQADSLPEIESILRSLLEDIESGEVPYIRHIQQLIIA